MHEPRATPAAGPGAWSTYYEKTGTRPPRETLIRALDAFDREPGDGRLAVDLGVDGAPGSLERRDVDEFGAQGLGGRLGVVGGRVVVGGLVVGVG